MVSCTELADADLLNEAETNCRTGATATSDYVDNADLFDEDKDSLKCRGSLSTDGELVSDVTHLCVTDSDTVTNSDSKQQQQQDVGRQQRETEITASDVTVTEPRSDLRAQTEPTTAASTGLNHSTVNSDGDDRNDDDDVDDDDDDDDDDESWEKMFDDSGELLCQSDAIEVNEVTVDRPTALYMQFLCTFPHMQCTC